MKAAWPQPIEDRMIELWNSGATADDIARTLTTEGFPCDYIRVNTRVARLRERGVHLEIHHNPASGKPIGGRALPTIATLPPRVGEVIWPESHLGCVWPLWPHDGPQGSEPRLFCGKARESLDRPYCPDHCRKAYTPRQAPL